jgi:putative pyruvate formate lyase activating enzyme
MSDDQPAYLKLLASGELRERVRRAHAGLAACSYCAWDCRKDRLAGKLGVCRTGALARLASYGPHHGEEKPLRGWRGSGTIFFAGCNLRCQYCQNYDISQGEAGQEVDARDLAVVMLELQARGCHNINLVSPSHVVPQILAAVTIAAQAGLHLPLVYNTGGYDSLEALALLDGIIDIYMPDMKYASPKIGQTYSKIRNYPQHNQAAVREMHRQVGDLQLDDSGLAVRGLLVRHLVLPNNLAGTKTVVAFLAAEISTQTYLNIMDQYRPAFNARQFAKLNRPIKAEEYQRAIEMAKAAGLDRLDHLI